jgi:hypothetical protein
MNTGLFDIIFKSGYNKAMKENNELIFEFARWICSSMYYYNSEISAWVNLYSDFEITDQEIFNLFMSEKEKN